ncbi:hypothetical protein TNCV_332771 [Trichonephila clavipes]|nr:hypothetical protein TNCV_332771 [Trichonephila clavipes]
MMLNTFSATMGRNMITAIPAIEMGFSPIHRPKGLIFSSSDNTGLATETLPEVFDFGVDSMQPSSSTKTRTMRTNFKGK